MKTVIETSDYTLAEWQAMYDEAGTVAELARRLGRHTETIRYHLRKVGVVCDPHSHPQPRPKKAGIYTAEQWQQMYDEAVTVATLAKQLKQPISTVRSQLVRAGITLRRSGFTVTNRKSAGRGPNHHNWKGGMYKKDGYIWEYAPDHPKAASHKGYVAQHRLVMERALGRYLETHEDVHHKNGDKTDNRLENLELLTRSEHIRQHKAVTQRDERGRFV